jgi:hypothetical protein
MSKVVSVKKGQHKSAVRMLPILPLESVSVNYKTLTGKNKRILAVYDSDNERRIEEITA